MTSFCMVRGCTLRSCRASMTTACAAGFNPASETENKRTDVAWTTHLLGQVRRCSTNTDNKPLGQTPNFRLPPVGVGGGRTRCVPWERHTRPKESTHRSTSGGVWNTSTINTKGQPINAPLAARVQAIQHVVIVQCQRNTNVRPQRRGTETGNDTT